MSKPNPAIAAHAILGLFAVMLSAIVLLFIELHHLQRHAADMRWRALSCEAAHKEWKP